MSIIAMAIKIALIYTLAIISGKPPNFIIFAHIIADGILISNGTINGSEKKLNV